MLTELQISNFAIIEEQTVTFGPGLNVISGETGSGKSIILHAIELVLGGRPKAHFLRSGAESLEVQALFELRDMPREVIESLPDIAQAEELAITRTLTATGRGKVYINGKLATVALLEAIVSRLVNICGQNQHVRLLEPSYHLELIDGIAENAAIRQRYDECWLTYSAARKQLEDASNRERTSRLREAELRAIVEDLENVKPRAGLRGELEAELKRLSNSERIVQKIQSIGETLNGDSGLQVRVGRLGIDLAELGRLDPGSAAVTERFQGVKDQLAEFESELDRYGASLVIDDEELETLRDRLAEVARLERKYRVDDSGLSELLEEAQVELRKLEDYKDLEKLRAAAQAAEKVLEKQAVSLRTSRRKAAEKLAKGVATELGELNMPDARLEVKMEEVPFGPSGGDRLEFLISTNAGEPFKPLRQIASGGELSRITLVLKKILRERSGVNVLVFDEVDTGISGSVARAVGAKLKELATHSQVICITHLAQVASMSDRHLLVGKKTGKGRTISVVKEISGEEKVDEIARMLAGYTITDSTRETARELLSSK